MRTRKDGAALMIGAIPPNLKLLPSNRKHLNFRGFKEATTRFELVIRVLQTHALPLGYVAMLPE